MKFAKETKKKSDDTFKEYGYGQPHRRQRGWLIEDSLGISAAASGLVIVWRLRTLDVKIDRKKGVKINCSEKPQLTLESRQAAITISGRTAAAHLNSLLTVRYYYKYSRFRKHTRNYIKC